MYIPVSLILCCFFLVCGIVIVCVAEAVVILQSTVGGIKNIPRGLN